MSEPDRNDAEDRLHACGISICHGGRSFPDGAMNGKGHLSIQTSGYREADLDQALPILHDLVETFELEFIGPVSDEDLRGISSRLPEHPLAETQPTSQVTNAGMRYLSDPQESSRPRTASAPSHRHGCQASGRPRQPSRTRSLGDAGGRRGRRSPVGLVWPDQPGPRRLRPVTDRGLEELTQVDQPGRISTCRGP